MAHQFGLVAVIGKPNVGKSTLVNALVGQKVSIVSNKPQTTRRRILGIVQAEEYQIGLLDTPGIHEAHNVLGREMLDAARSSLVDVDLVLYVADVSHHPGAGDQRIADLIKKAAPDVPRVLALNKMDLLKADRVMPHVEAYTALLETESYMLTTATREQNLSELLEVVLKFIPEGESRFEPDEFTDQPLKFMAAELIRERILAKTRQELPYSTAVMIEQWEQTGGRVRVNATILVERSSQRAILLGKGGAFIKEIGTEARLAIQDLTDCPVHLELFVKVDEGWRSSPTSVAELHYNSK